MIEVSFENNNIVLVFKTQVSEEYRNQMLKKYRKMFKKQYVNDGTIVTYREDFE